MLIFHEDYKIYICMLTLQFSWRKRKTMIAEIRGKVVLNKIKIVEL